MNKIAGPTTAFCKELDTDCPLQSDVRPRVVEQNLKFPEVIEGKRKELRERAFTTFCSRNWDEDQIDSLAELARKNDKKFVPYNKDVEAYSDLTDETDSYDENTSFIRRSYIEGSPSETFKEIESIRNPFSDDGSLMAHSLVNSVLSCIFELLSDEMRPEQDRIEVSLIRQCASSMPELDFHTDKVRQVFILMLACNFKENDGAEMSIKGMERFLCIENIDYYQVNIPSLKGNGYLIRENTARRKNIYIEHRRGAFATQVTSPERITLRILVDSKNKPITEVV